MTTNSYQKHNPFDSVGQSTKRRWARKVMQRIEVLGSTYPFLIVFVFEFIFVFCICIWIHLFVFVFVFAKMMQRMGVFVLEFSTTDLPQSEYFAFSSCTPQIQLKIQIQRQRQIQRQIQLQLHYKCRYQYDTNASTATDKYFQLTIVQCQYFALHKYSYKCSC